MDQNQGKAVVTGFHSETSESEVTQLFKESKHEVGMDIGNARIECTAKPITHAFIHFKNDGERNKFIRSANMLKRELIGRKIRITETQRPNVQGHVTAKCHFCQLPILQERRDLATGPMQPDDVQRIIAHIAFTRGGRRRIFILRPSFAFALPRWTL